jgi:hypothetical protein
MKFINTAPVRNHAAEYGHPLQKYVHKFLNSPLGLRTANVTALHHYVPYHCYLLNQSSKFCSQNSLHCFSVGTFCVLNVINDFIMADLGKKYISVKFCYKHQRTTSEMHKILKVILVTIAWTEHRLLIVVLSSNMEKIGLKIFVCSGQNPGVCC